MSALVLLTSSIGLPFGSFLGVLVDRVPGGRNIVSGRSRCDACGRTLNPRDLVPVLSWLALRGRCRGCGAQIGVRPLIMEMGTSLLFAIAALVAVDVWQGVLIAPFLGVLLALTAIDLEYRRLPNAIVYPSVMATALIVGAAEFFGGALSLRGAAAGGLLFGGGLLLVAMLSRGGMGLGDVKLAGLIGAVVGARDLPSVAVAAGVAILVGGLAAIAALLRGAERRSSLPFGPMLSVGALAAVLIGPRVASAYLGLFR